MRQAAVPANKAGGHLAAQTLASVAVPPSVIPAVAVATVAALVALLSRLCGGGHRDDGSRGQPAARPHEQHGAGGPRRRRQPHKAWLQAPATQGGEHEAYWAVG